MAKGYGLLVNLQDRFSPRPSEDYLMAKRGDIIAVHSIDDLQSGAIAWGSEETLPKFARLYLWINNAVRAKIAKYLRNEWANGAEPPFEEPIYPEGRPPPVVRFRAWRLKIDDIPLAIRQKVAQTGELHVGGPVADVTWSQVRAFIERKYDAQTESDLGTSEADFT